MSDDESMRRLQNRNATLECELHEAQAMQKHLVEVLRQIIADLPMRRDWLDPHLEKRAKALLNEIPS